MMPIQFAFSIADALCRVNPLISLHNSENPTIRAKQQQCTYPNIEPHGKETMQERDTPCRCHRDTLIGQEADHATFERANTPWQECDAAAKRKKPLPHSSRKSFSSLKCLVSFSFLLTNLYRFSHSPAVIALLLPAQCQRLRPLPQAAWRVSLPVSGCP